jgi:hypothetical protein
MPYAFFLLLFFHSGYLDWIPLLSSYLCVSFGHGLMCYEVSHAVLSCSVLFCSVGYHVGRYQFCLGACRGSFFELSTSTNTNAESRDSILTRV